MQQGTPQFQDTPPFGSFSQQGQPYQAPQVGTVRQYGQQEQYHQPRNHQSQLQQNQQKQKRKGNQDVSQMVLCPPERFISVPTTDLIEAFRGQFSAEDFERFSDICKLFEANSRLDFITVSRRVQDNFRLFSAAAKGMPVPMRKGTELPSPKQLDQTELRFLEDFCNLLVTAHYRLLTEQEWETATDEEFTFNMPIEVKWDVMDTLLLARFWSGHPQLRRGTAQLLERIMVFHRGVHTARSKGLYIEDKIDLLMGYLVVNPIAALAGKFLGYQAQEKAKKYSPLTSSNDKAPVADLSRDEGIHDHDSARIAGLNHPNAKIARRITLQRLMPDAASVLKLSLTTLEIQEPCFTDLVILYRKSKAVLDRPSSEKEPLPKYSKGMAQRNIVVKSFSDVPMADVEMIFPEKAVFIKPFVLIQLIVTVILAVITVVTTLIQSKVNLSVLASMASIAAARAAQVWSRAQLTRQQMQDAMTQGLYEKSADSQEGVLHTVLNQMSDQHTKEVIIAYAVLLLRGEAVTQDGLDKRCEMWLERIFGLRLDFAIENSLPVCLEDGVIERDDQSMLRPLTPAKALKVLKHKWEHHFDKQTAGGADVKVPGSEPITQERPYDMSITSESQQRQPEPQPIPSAAPQHLSNLTQRRPAEYDSAPGQYTASASGAGQYQGSGAGQYQGSGGLYTSPGQFGAGPTVPAGQYAGTISSSGQPGAVNYDGGNSAGQQGYTSSPRFSSTPVDWGNAASSGRTGTDSAYQTTFSPGGDSVNAEGRPSVTGSDTVSGTGEPRHPHLDRILHPFHHNQSG